MRFRMLSVPITFLCGLGLAFAQPSSPLAISVQTAENGSQVLRIENTGGQTATALVLTWPIPVPANAVVGEKKLAGARQVLLYDSAASPKVAPIAAGAAVTIPSPAAGATGPPQVQAVLFAGGASWGDPGWIGRITRRRTYMRQSVEAVLADFKAALAGPDINIVQLIAKFQSALSAEEKAAADGEQRACIRIVRGASSNTSR
jgi:hypothetical protein